MSTAAKPLPRSKRLNGAVSPRDLHRFKLSEFQRMFELGILGEGERLELLEGVVVQMPLAGPSHDGVLGSADEELSPLLPKPWFPRIQCSLFTEDSWVVPDIAVTKGPRKLYHKRHPVPGDIAMIIEVSEGTLARDKGWKAHIYAKASIPWYWVVDVKQRRVEVFSDPSGPSDEPSYRVHESLGLKGSAAVVIAGQQCGRIEVKKLFAE
jgi:Uma2 family endonuclease